MTRDVKKVDICECAGIGRQARLRGVCFTTYGFKSRHSHQIITVVLKNHRIFCYSMYQNFQIFIEIQNEFLQEEIRKKGITDISELEPIIDDIYLWKGDITTLKCGAIVNAANSELLGCFNPNHLCIDNTIHTYAGIQLRLECNDIMKAQGHSEPIGKAKITSAYNLPSKYIIHTVGPMIFNKVMKKDCDALENCYRSCLSLADEYDVNSIAFCCISTGEFKFPNNIAAELAVRSVKRYKQETGSRIKVIFNVFRENDNQIYRKLLEE